jgi:hypothetical protein
MNRKKELKREYQQNPPRMGVLQIRNLVNDKVLVIYSTNLGGIINRHQFQLKAGGYPNRQLQADWNALGPDKFAFEVLDELSPPSDAGRDYRAELESLEDIWLDQLQPYDERGYNERKKTREERLRMIAANNARRPDEGEA